MFNSGYKVWNLQSDEFHKQKDFQGQIKVLLQYASLAPSTFNSQPWKYKIINEVLELYLDKTRIPYESDKTGKFAYFSIGCFIENLDLAGRYYGLVPNIQYHKDTDKPLVHVASITFTNKAKDEDLEKLFLAIPQRTTNRSFDTGKPIPSEILHQIQSLSNSTTKVIIKDQKELNKLIEISKIGDTNIWTKFNFRKEHVGWIRNNLTFAHDGMPAFGVGASTLSSFLATPVVLSPIFPKMQMIKNIKLLTHSQNYIVISSIENPQAWIQTGRLFEKINLMLTTIGIAASPMGQFIEDEQAREKLEKLIELNHSMLPQIFIRIGFPTKQVPHSPRLTIDEILIH